MDDELYAEPSDSDILAFSEIEEIEEDSAEDIDAASVVEVKALPPGTPVYQLHINCSCETIYAMYNGHELKSGITVLAATRYGKDLARLSGRICNRILPNISKITRIERVATEADLEKEKNNKLREAEAFRICKQKIIDRNLAMKLVTVHFLLEEPKILFFFIAENRIDFRELVRDLVAIFKMRIELRQIGIRDDARMTGGFGICGRPFCCCSISDKLKPVAIKMAKEQNLSLNSMKISGLCGRLLCCLAYEHDIYAEQRRVMPGEGAKIVIDGVIWKVLEVNAVLGMITLCTGDGRKQQLSKNRFEKINNIWGVKERHL
jgi:cell fate regulator YaaT (PSP1 superfamily)